MPLLGTDVITKATALKRFWSKRDAKMKTWYSQIQMVDELAQKDMESFVGNDPRASFNLISSILDQRIPHRLPAESLGVDQVQPAAELSMMFDTIWENIHSDYKSRGRNFQETLIKFLLATGWYSVFASLTMDGSAAVAEVWNPITVYPKWDNVLVECAHVFTPGATQIQRMAARNGWKLSSDPADKTVIYDYWWVEQQLRTSVVHNSIMIGNDNVKLDTIESRFKRIPIFVFPIGGLPDTGELSSGRRYDDWKAEVGQSFIATNENVYKAFNKWWTFILQMLRDTVQARTFERSSSTKTIVQPESWYRRGAHYKLGLQDEVGFIQPPALPAELRSIQLDMEAMLQRGGPSWTMFGSIQQRMTAYAMAQVVATTNQIAKNFHRGVIDCITDIDNFLYDMIRNNGYTPYGLSIPENLPPIAKLSAEYELRIPGDLAQRATTARMLNPDFELSDERIMEEIFPEIKNPTEELARVRAGKARRNPIFAQISLIEALRQQATLLRDARDMESAALFDKAADRAEAMLVGVPEQPAQPGRVGVRPEVIPPSEQLPRVPARRGR